MVKQRHTLGPKGSVDTLEISVIHSRTWPDYAPYSYQQKRERFNICPKVVGRAVDVNATRLGTVRIPIVPGLLCRPPRFSCVPISSRRPVHLWTMLASYTVPTSAGLIVSVVIYHQALFQLLVLKLLFLRFQTAPIEWRFIIVLLLALFVCFQFSCLHVLSTASCCHPIVPVC